MTKPRALRPTVALVPLLTLLCLLAVTPAAALPMHGEEATLAQPDGSDVAVRLWGDEYHQRLEDLAGYTLDGDGQANPGETVQLSLQLRNGGTASAAGVTARLVAVPKDSYLGVLRGTRNRLAFTTRRYRTEPPTNGNHSYGKDANSNQNMAMQTTIHHGGIIH